MSFYHFPIILGEHESERVVMMHLTDGDDPENRVIITSGSAQKPLFKIPKKVKFVDHGGNFRGNVNFSDDKTKGKDYFKVETGGNLVTLKDSGDYYKYFVKNDKAGRFDADIDFTLIIDYGKENESTFIGKVHIARPSGSDEIMKINVDLGSDATQVNYFSDESGVPIQPVDLIGAMVDSYESNRKYGDLKEPTTKEPLYTQQEKNRKEFYKTGNITFHKYEKSSKGNIELDITDPNTFINYLNVSSAGKNEAENQSLGSDTWEKEYDFNKKLINIKMLYAHMLTVGGYVDDIKYTDNEGITYSVNDYDHILRVLRSIYHQIISASTKKIGKAKCKYYSVLLLVPNIYVQQNIDFLLSELNKELNKPEETDSVKYDFRVISESDAAFVGIKISPTGGIHGSVLGQIIEGETDPKQKDMFLIVDAGKGTTDYSIVHYDASNDANNSMTSIKRGGIVGAGGAIDYVFARVFARQVFRCLNIIGINAADVKTDEGQFVERFMTLIQKLPPVDQDRMMLIVEAMKKNYKKGHSAKAYTCFATEESKKIILNLIKENETYDLAMSQTDGWKQVSKWNRNAIDLEPTCDVDDKEVEWVCKAIAKAVVDDVFEETPEAVTNQIDYIIFTGRSFLFEPLKRAFEEKVKPYRDVFSVNYEYPLFVVKLVNHFVKKKKDLKNLKVANLETFDMKAISVRFDKHDLGMNCNSDLCCVDLLSVIGDDNQSTFEKSCFWEGFDGTDGKLHYYIGHSKGAFAPPLNQQNVIRRIPIDEKLDLVNMTMFPVHYEKAKFKGLYSDGFNQPNNSSINGGAPAGPQNHPANPNGSNSQNGISAPTDNTIPQNSSISGQTIPLGTNNGLDINDL